MWIEPTANRFTSPLVLAQEEHILAWARDAQPDIPSPSTTVGRGKLDVVQYEAAAAVAGTDGLVVIVGPAGAGKTTMLRAAVDDLRAHGRPVFGVAPSAKAARVLEVETGMVTDTVAKLLYEWDRPDRDPTERWRLPAGTTIVVDEAGMASTNDLYQLTTLAAHHQWRLALVGDPRQLQAVGRGGMFAEVGTCTKPIELEQIHRFTHPWEAAASLQLRHGNPAAFDQYVAHDRVVPGTLRGPPRHHRRRLDRPPPARRHPGHHRDDERARRRDQHPHPNGPPRPPPTLRRRCRRWWGSRGGCTSATSS